MRRHILSILLVSILFASTTTPMTSSSSTSQANTSGNPKIQAEGNETAPKYGGTLRNIGFCPLENLNPYVSMQALALPIYNCLVTTGENWSIAPDLAESWEVSEDGLNYTFHLYGNVTWHDGVEFNASDVKFTYETIIYNPEVNGFWKECEFDSIINSIYIFNRTTIVFRLNYVYPSFMYRVAVPIIAEHLYEGTDLLTNPNNDNPVGTGPFKFVSWETGVSLTLSANNAYFRGRPYLNSVILRYDIPLSQQTECLRNNTIDIAGCLYQLLDPSKIAELEQIPGISVMSTESLGYKYLGLNLRNPVLNDLRVRQAFAYAINKTKIIEVSYLRYATEANGPICPTLADWYDSNVTKYAYNCTRSEELLDEAGFPRDPETGVRMNITLKVGDWDPYRISAAYLIRDFLLNVGVNSTVQLESRSQLTDDVVGTHSFDLVVWGWEAIAPDPNEYLYDFWHTGGQYNLWNYSNNEVDSLLEGGRVETNQSVRREIYDEVQETVSSEHPNVFLCHVLYRMVFNNDFHGFSEHPNVNNVVQYDRIWYDPTLSGQGKSPVEVLWTDSDGRRTGSFEGTVFNEIPNSTYTPDQNLVKLQFSEGNYTVLLHGTGNGEYHLEVVNVALEYKYTTIPCGYITADEVKQYDVQVFGDGTFKVTTDNMLDIYKDGKIDARDVARVASVYGSYGPNYKYPGSPQHPRWYQMADINSDNKIDVRDVAWVCSNYGKHL